MIALMAVEFSSSEFPEFRGIPVTEGRDGLRAAVILDTKSQGWPLIMLGREAAILIFVDSPGIILGRALLS